MLNSTLKKEHPQHLKQNNEITEGRCFYAPPFSIGGDDIGI